MPLLRCLRVVRRQHGDCPTPPDTGEFNPVLAAVQGITLFRDVCRQELMAEQIYDAVTARKADLRKVKTEARNALHSLVELFTALRRPTPRMTNLDHLWTYGR